MSICICSSHAPLNANPKLSAPELQWPAIYDCELDRNPKTLLDCKQRLFFRRGNGSRLVAGDRLVVFPRPNCEKATTSRDPLSSWEPLPPSPFPKRCRRVGRKGGPGSKGSMGSRLVMFLGLYGVKKRRNTMSRVPPTSLDPRIFQVVRFKSLCDVKWLATTAGFSAI